MLMLIQQAEKKENSSPKKCEMRYEMSFGDVDDWLKYCLYCHHALYSVEIVDDSQTNDELNTFSNFFNQGTNL